MMFTNKARTVRIAGSHKACPTTVRPFRPAMPCRAHNKDEYKENPLYAKEAGNAAVEGASQGAEAVKGALVDTGDRLKEAAGETGDAIKDAAKSVSENVKEGVEAAQGPRADSGVHDTWESVQDSAKGTVRDIKKGVEGAEERIGGQ